jgi:hypothetical protein
VNDLRVTVDDRRNQGQLGLFGILLFVGFIGAFWQYIVVALLFTASLTCLYLALKYRALEQRQLGIRADEQMGWEAMGDPRGIYGHDFGGTTNEGLQPTVPACESWPVSDARAAGLSGAFS